MNEEIRLRNAKKVFPKSIRRLSPHDFINIALDKKKHLSAKEFDKLNDYAEVWKHGNSDIIAVRKGRKVKFIPF